MTPFSSVLRALRASAGFPSARAFYKARKLGCTYRALLDIEAGRSLPRPALARRLAAALGLAGPAARPFAVAYLNSLAGGSELAGLMLSALEPEGGPKNESLFRRAAEFGLQQRSRPLTRQQCELLVSDPAVYWCFTALSNDRGAWTAPELAKPLGLSPAAAREALRRLASAGLVEEDAGGRWRCPFVGAVFTFPRDRLFVPRYREALARLWSAAARPGLRETRLVESTEAALRALLPSMAQSVYGAHVYGRLHGGPDSAFFVVSTAVRRLEQP